MYIITNEKNRDYFIKDVESPRDFIINTLDLSLEWNYESFNESNKGDLIKYITLFDSRIKEVDSAIPLHISNMLRDININRQNLVTVYFKKGSVEIINILEYYIILKNSL